MKRTDWDRLTDHDQWRALHRTDRRQPMPRAVRHSVGRVLVRTP